MRKQDEFLVEAEKFAFNREHRNRMQLNVHSYESAFVHAKKQFANLELARDRAAYFKWKVTENLDKYLIEFESNVIRKGGKVLWADDAKGALAEIEMVLNKLNTQLVVKSQSTITNEIGLNTFLRAKGIDVVETSVGEYINDVANEQPYHTVTPAMHKTKLEITQLLNDKISTSIDADPQEIIADIDAALRGKINKANVAITGANFLIADSGMVAIAENDGSARLCTSVPQALIIVGGIEKVIPSINDVDLFFSLFSTYSSGQKLSTYNSIIGPKPATEVDGPKEFYVVLVDNGRSNILAQHDQREALGCISCGACSNVCPVFQNIGGHAYGGSNKGPIGAVWAQHQFGIDEFKHLSYASPICGKCTEVCPVKINIHNHLLHNRKDVVHQGHVKNGEKLIWYSWKKFMLSRKNLNKSSSIKAFMLKQFFKTEWGERREFPKLADKSFNQLWRERFGQ
ncbi:MAG: lactate utilization protein [Bacteroidia bacterium]|nr:lactate utilization protein [Bacteroidia bacterium]